jgi:hypothetical protein
MAGGGFKGGRMGSQRLARRGPYAPGMEPSTSLGAAGRWIAIALLGATLACDAAAATLRGRVVDAVDATPIAGAAIRVDFAIAAQVQTDVDGRFEISAPGPTVWIRASAASRLYLDSQRVVQDVAADAVIEGIELALGRAARLSGTVRRIDGSPVAFAEVALVGPPARPTDPNPTRTATTEVDGSYSVDRIAPGSYVVHARKAGVLMGQASGGVDCPDLRYCPRERITTLALEGFDEVVGVDFSLRSGAVLAGETRGTDGTRLFSFVTAYDEQLRPVAQGLGNLWELPALPPGRYRLTASAADDGRFLPVVYPGQACPATACDPATGTPVDTVAGITLVDMVQPRAAELRFPIVEATSTRPPLPLQWDSRVEALLVDPATEGSNGLRRCSRRPVGGTLPAVCFLPTGRYRFESRSTGWRDQRFSGIDCEPAGCAADAGTIVDVAQGSVVEMPAITMATIGGIAVTVRGDGLDLWGVRVEALDADGNRVADTSRNRFGSVATLDLEPGNYWIRTRAAPGYIDRLYPDIPCNTGCDPAAGLAVSVEGDRYTTITIDLGRADILVRDGFELFPLN